AVRRHPAQGCELVSGRDAPVIRGASLARGSALASAGFSKMMTCCQGRNSSDSLNEGILRSEEGPVRYYWTEFDRIIGASCGEETPFVLVEHHQSGPFHGHPVTWEELKRKGARDEDRRSR